MFFVGMAATVMLALSAHRPGVFVVVSDLADLIREKAPNASNRWIAERAGVRPGTIDRMMNGVGTPKLDTIDKVARALGIPLHKARQAAGRPRGETGPYVPPEESRLLDERQRRALDELIRSFVTMSGQEHTDGTAAGTHITEPGQETRGTLERGAGETTERPMTTGDRVEPNEAAVQAMSDAELEAAAQQDPLWADYLKTRHPEKIGEDWDF